jgi:hypothetical protein
MLDHDHQDAGKPGTDPLLVLLVSFLLLNPVIACQVKTLRVVRLEVRVGWSRTKVVYAINEVVVKNGDGEVSVGVLIEPFGHQDNG